MNAEQFAAMLNGREYRKEISKEEQKVAKENNLLVVTGYSDDLTSFYGAIEDETGAPMNGDINFFFNGEYQIMEEEELGDYRQLIAKGWSPPETSFSINVQWCPDHLQTSWLITPNGLEFFSFDIMEDGELYCRGFVMDMYQLET